jgi:hypothetical protein
MSMKGLSTVILLVLLVTFVIVAFVLFAIFSGGGTVIESLKATVWNLLCVGC